MSEFDAPVKYSVICLCAYWVFAVAMPKRESRSKYVIGGLLTLIPALFMTLLRDVLVPFHIAGMVTVFVLVMLWWFQLRVNEIVPLIMVSFGISYAAFFISTMLTIVSAALYCEHVLGDYRIADIFFESAVIHVTAVLFMQVLYIALIYWVLRLKRIRNGLANIVKLGMSDVGLYLSVMILLGTSLFGVSSRYHINDISSCIVWFILMCCIVTMIFWLKREIKVVYIHKKMNDENEMLQKSLDEKDKLIAALREDNDRLAGVIHKDNKLIPAMVASVRQCVSGMEQESDDFSQTAAKALEIAEQLESIYGERAAALSCYESHGKSLPSTGVTAVDAILFYMARRAAEHDIAFTVDVTADVKDLLEHTIERREFNTILADLVENALIAAQDSEAKAVSVGIGSEGERQFLRVSDSGRAFDADVLKHMGLKKITTRANKGGSGTGLMNLFTVLRKYGADFSIEDCPPDSAFTKSLTVFFNA